MGQQGGSPNAGHASSPAGQFAHVPVAGSAHVWFAAQHTGPQVCANPQQLPFMHDSPKPQQVPLQQVRNPLQHCVPHGVLGGSQHAPPTQLCDGQQVLPHTSPDGQHWAPDRQRSPAGQQSKPQTGPASSGQQTAGVFAGSAHRSPAAQHDEPQHASPAPQQ